MPWRFRSLNHNSRYFPLQGLKVHMSTSTGQVWNTGEWWGLQQKWPTKLGGKCYPAIADYYRNVSAVSQKKTDFCFFGLGQKSFFLHVKLADLKNNMWAKPNTSVGLHPYVFWRAGPQCAISTLLPPVSLVLINITTQGQKWKSLHYKPEKWSRIWWGKMKNGLLPAIAGKEIWNLQFTHLETGSISLGKPTK